MRTGTTTLLLAALVVGCTTPDDQETQTVDPREARQERSPELLAALDSGSAAYRADAWETSLEHYTRATELAPDEAAAWFGVFMAQRALGNGEAADSAMDRARRLAPGATLIHPTAEDTVAERGGAPR